MTQKENPSKSWFRRRWSDVLIGIFIILMLFPQTRTPIMVFVQRTIAFGPSISRTDEQAEDYNWNMYSLEGDPVSFNDAKGEVVLLNFWATWCPPCIAEMPYLQNLYNDYGEKVKFFFVTDEDPQKISAFMEKHQYDLPVQINQQLPPRPFEAKALPTTYVLGKNGDIHIKKTGSAKWDSKKVRNLLDDLLKE